MPNEMQMHMQQQSPFEQIRHTDEAGDYWLARELMPLLEFATWQDFDLAVQRASADCAKAGRSIEEHFRVFRVNPKNSPKGGRPPKNYRLTRYACRLIVMAASRTTGEVAAKARTYFSDKVEEAEQSSAVVIEIEIPESSPQEDAEIFSNPETAYRAWRERAIQSYIAAGYSAEWATQRVDDITSRNALTHEWGVRGIKKREYPILTNRLHMRSFGLSIEEHKGFKGFVVTYKGKKLVYKGDLPPALTMTELALNTLANTVARELHVRNDSHGFTEIANDVDVAGKIVGDTRRQIEAATGKPVVSARNMIKEPDGALWAQLPAPDAPDAPEDEES